MLTTKILFYKPLQTILIERIIYKMCDRTTYAARTFETEKNPFLLCDCW